MKKKNNPPWMAIDLTNSIDGLTGKAKRDILFWNTDAHGKMVSVYLPKGTIPVVNKVGQV